MLWMRCKYLRAIESNRGQSRGARARGGAAAHLATREVAPLLLHLVLEAVRQRPYEFAELREVEDAPELLVGVAARDVEVGAQRT